ncbi:MAG TPA: trypsin-like peptidase domain-containing protein [Solirubrobacteraceae bacterium]|jgi:S1-C subfamily serine protease|nr:trypsin-like peptidase domain-containing protein [Solirubrobacteraceae bacterium]
MTANRPLLASFLAGGLGGALLAGAILGVLAASGSFDSSKTTVTVQQQAPVVSGSDASVRSAGGPTVRQVYERDAPGVVFVSASGVSQAQTASEFLKGESGGGQGTATGSGFEVDVSGTILTNWHVVEGASKITVGFDRGRTVEARILGKDPSHDIAVLRVPTAGLTLHPLTLGDSSTAHVGDPVLAIGNPFGLARTLTTGVLSALERQIQAPNGLTIDDVLQTDAPINPGNSGGPLLDEDGQVIGINSQIETGGERGGSVGIAFAIPINTATDELAKLERGG